jgi:hypothetical protein
MNIHEHPVVVMIGALACVIITVGVCFVWYLLPIVGVVALGTCIIVLACLSANAVLFTFRQFMQLHYHDIGDFGTHVSSVLGKSLLLPPIAQTTATNASKIAKADLQTAIPTLLDLLAIGEIFYGMQDMILGYLESGTVVRGSWPRTFAVAGKGRSGKTRRVVFMLIQALMGGAHITVCDPHYTKRDSLTKELMPLSPWLTFAGTDSEIEAETDSFLSEMERRVHRESQESIGDGIYKPRLIIYDEWSRLMSKLTEEQQYKLKGTVTSTSQEYAGYDGYCCIIGQDWTHDVCGGTAIRRALHAVFVHRIDIDYAKYLIKPAKWHKQTEQLNTGHCFYQDLDGKISKLIMPHVEDRIGAKVAEILSAVAPPQKHTQLDYTTSKPDTEPLELKFLEAPREVPAERINASNNCYETSCELPQSKVFDAHYASVLREIGKKLKAGETASDIRKSLGITGGRAFQEVTEALQFLQEDTSES